jgi:hypothetical protein
LLDRLSLEFFRITLAAHGHLHRCQKVWLRDVYKSLVDSPLTIGVASKSYEPF